MAIETVKIVFVWIICACGLVTIWYCLLDFRKRNSEEPLPRCPNCGHPMLDLTPLGSFPHVCPPGGFAK